MPCTGFYVSQKPVWFHNEIGVFEMKQKGLYEVTNPSQVMLDGRPLDASGFRRGLCHGGDKTAPH